MKEIKPVVTEKHHFDIRDQSFSVTTFLESLEYQDSDARININEFSIAPSSTESRLQNDILLEGINPVVIEKNEVE